MKGFNAKSPMGRIMGSGFRRSGKSIDKVLQSGFGGYKVKRGEKLEKV